VVTAGKAIGALPEIAAGKPKAVQGFGMLSKVVFGRDGNGELFFNTDGKLPDNMPPPRPAAEEEKKN